MAWWEDDSYHWESLWKWCYATGKQLNRIEAKLNNLTREGRNEMAAIDDLVREVSETKGVAESVKVAFAGLKEQLAEAIRKLEEALASNNTAAIEAATAELDAIQAGLAELLPAVVTEPA